MKRGFWIARFLPCMVATTLACVGDTRSDRDAPGSKDGVSGDGAEVGGYGQVKEGEPCRPGDTPPDGYFRKGTWKAANDVPFFIGNVLGTGDYICEARPGEEPRWDRVWGTDYGQFYDDGMVNMCMTSDNDMNADGTVYMKGADGPWERAYRRGEPFPCQPPDVGMPNVITPFGEPALLAHHGHINVLFHSQPGTDKPGKGMGLYYYSKTRRQLHAIRDNRTPAEALARARCYGCEGPSCYQCFGSECQCDRGIAYSCDRLSEVPVKACESAPCRWVAFWIFTASDRVDTVLVRAAFAVGEGEQEEMHTGLFTVRVLNETPEGAEEKPLAFDVKAVVDSSSGVQVPGQPDGVVFTGFTAGWINERHVIVFGARYDRTSDSGAKPQGSYGLFAIHEGRLVRIADNRPGQEGIVFEEFDCAQPEDLEPPVPLVADDLVGGDMEALRRAALAQTTDLVMNNSGVDRLGNVFFTATYREGASKRRGLFMAMPRLDRNNLAYDVVVVEPRRVMGGIGIGELRPGPLCSLAVNDYDEVFFKSMRAEGDGTPLEESGVLYFYDGSVGQPWNPDNVSPARGDLYVIRLPDEDLQTDAVDTGGVLLGDAGSTNRGKWCSTPLAWPIIAGFALNDRGEFLFRVGCASHKAERGTIWAVFRGVYGPHFEAVTAR